MVNCEKVAALLKNIVREFGCILCNRHDDDELMMRIMCGKQQQILQQITVHEHATDMFAKICS